MRRGEERRGEERRGETRYSICKRWETALFHRFGVPTAVAARRTGGVGAVGSNPATPTISSLKK